MGKLCIKNLKITMKLDFHLFSSNIKMYLPSFLLHLYLFFQTIKDYSTTEMTKEPTTSRNKHKQAKKKTEQQR